MIPLRIHYLTNGKPRCGNPLRNATTNPKKVTCESCKRLMEKELQA